MIKKTRGLPVPKGARLLSVQEAVQEIEHNYEKVTDPFRRLVGAIILQMVREGKISAWLCKDGSLLYFKGMEVS